MIDLSELYKEQKVDEVIESSFTYLDVTKNVVSALS